jgi:uncharacterized membrane protein YdbT with pleckstrin-like domain
MSYADNLMAQGEHVTYHGRQHWLAPISDALRPIVLVLVGLIVLFAAMNLNGIFGILAILSAILLVVGVVWIAIVYFTWRAEEYLITNRRVLKVEGLLDKKSGDSSLDKINDAVLKQGLLARMLKYGDLEILTSNEEGIDRYQMLAHVVDFKKAMLDAKNNLEDGGRGYTSGAAAASADASAAGDEVSGKLDKLASLLRSGKITQADYDKKKADILDKM